MSAEAPTPAPLLVGVREAAKMLNLGRDHMYSLVRAGEVRSIAVGRRRLVPVVDLAAWVERAATGAEPSDE